MWLKTTRRAIIKTPNLFGVLQHWITGSIISIDMKVFIENNSLYFNEVKFIFSLFAFNKKIAVTYVNSIADSDISIGDSDNNTLKISLKFYIDLNNGIYSHYHHFALKPLIELANGTPDFLSTAFYLVTCQSIFQTLFSLESILKYIEKIWLFKLMIILVLVKHPKL